MTSKTYSAMTSGDLTKLRPQSVAVSKGDKWWPATEQPYTSRSRIAPLRVPLTQRLENQSCFPVWPVTMIIDTDGSSGNPREDASEHQQEFSLVNTKICGLVGMAVSTTIFAILPLVFVSKLRNNNDPASKSRFCLFSHLLQGSKEAKTPIDLKTPMEFKAALYCQYKYHNRQNPGGKLWFHYYPVSLAEFSLAPASSISSQAWNRSSSRFWD